MEFSRQKQCGNLLYKCKYLPAVCVTEKYKQNQEQKTGAISLSEML